MERVFYLGGATTASILAVAPAGHLMIWAWLLITAEAAVWVLLRQQPRSKAEPVPVPLPARRPTCRPAPRSPQR